MALLSVKVLEYVDDGYPGWVRAVFNDANGKEWSIVDKTVYFEGYDELGKDSIYPQPNQIECRVIGEREGTDNRRILLIDIEVPNGLNAEDGTTKFEFSSDQINERE
jgi:hypothetical protein